MADNRIRLLQDITTGDLESLLNTLYLAVDDTTFTNVEKVLFKTLLSEAIVADNSINYKAMTPKAFYNSVMTEARKGINRFATDVEVTAKTTSTVLLSIHQILMQAQWLKDWFESNGTPNIFAADDLTTPKAMVFQVTFNQSMTSGVDYSIAPSPPSGYRYHTITIVYSAHGGGIVGNGFKSLNHTGGTVSQILLSGLLVVKLTSNGKIMYLNSSVTQGYVVSLSVTATIAPV